MRVIGLTGGMGMGKSTVARMFAWHGIPAFNADEAVHKLQAPHGRAIPAITAAFPGTVKNGVLDRAALRNIVLSDPAALRRLEKIMHPLVRRMQQEFRARSAKARRRAILLDIPLLFETQGRKGMDAVLAVSCPRDVQLRRVRHRRTMSDEQISAILAKQMPDAQRRALADYVIHTGLSRFHTYRTVRRLIDKLLS
jgi:dephospho-CoA kinase